MTTPTAYLCFPGSPLLGNKIMNRVNIKFMPLGALLLSLIFIFCAAPVELCAQPEDVIVQAEALLQPGVNLDTLRQALSQRMQQRLQTRGGTLQSKAKWLGEKNPELVKARIQAADRAMAGLLVLPGTQGQPFAVGVPPRWNANPVNDKEYVWKLNRTEHWPVLLEAWQLTGKRAYAEKVVAELDDWLTHCPAPAIPEKVGQETLDAYCDVTPWRILEAGIRMFGSWPQLFEHLIDDPLLTRELFARLVISLHAHGEALAKVSPVLWPRADHNHFTHEALGLLSVSVLLPELKESAAWRDQAVDELVRCANAQYVADGGQNEGSPNYHDLSLYWYSVAFSLAKEAKIAFPASTVDHLRRAIDYVQYATRPNGLVVPLGDSDANSVGVEATIWWLYATGDIEPLRTLAALCGKKTVTDAIQQMCWYLPDPDGILRQLEIPRAKPLPTVNWQKGLGQVALRTGWDRDALSIFFSCLSPVHSGHAHIDPAGFDFTALGVPMVVDPGRFCYREGEDRKAFKGSAYHNTLTVNDREPFAYLSTFSFGPQAKGNIRGVWQSQNLLAAACQQENFQPAHHQRAIALVANRYLVVLDVVDGLKPTDTVQRWFHLDTTQVTWTPERNRVQAEYGTDARLALYSTATASTVSGSLVPGRVSDALDLSRPSTRLRLESRSGSARRTFASVLIPRRLGESDAAFENLQLEDVGDGVRCSFQADGQVFTLRWQKDDLTVNIRPVKSVLGGIRTMMRHLGWH